MANYNFRRADGVLPFPLSWFSVDISSEDYEDDNGFAAKAEGTGTLTYTPFDNFNEETQEVKPGDFLSPHSTAPAILRRVKADATVGSIKVIKYSS